MERQFLSGDVCDLVFVTPEEAVVVEVKKGQTGELVKGVHQGIKYRALLEAELSQKDYVPIRVVLAAYTMPFEIVDYAHRFDIQSLCVERSSMKLHD